MDLRVVVEVDVHVTSLEPRMDLRAPLRELLIGVIARIERAGSMQPDVDEIRRHRFGVTELPCRVRDDERAVVLAQDRVELLAEIGRMPHLERVSVRHAYARLRQRTAPKTKIVLPRDSIEG